MKHHLDFEKPIIELQAKLEELKKHPGTNPLGISFEEEVSLIEKKLEETRKQIFANLSAWDRIKIARHPKRPFTLDYLNATFTGFTELHGDRLFADDRAVVGGFAQLGPHKVMVIGTQKGRDTKENILRNFGSAHPEGYRKALRLMKMAHKFHLPIITLIDTAGAYPGIGAEERHIAEAIAVNLREMMLFEVPIIATVIGEGGSGGALGIGVADRVLILENAYYSVISPEGCAAILWKDRAAAAKAAEALKITARHLLDLGLVDEIIPEPLGGAHTDPLKMTETAQECLHKQLDDLLKMDTKERLKQRYAKFRAFGRFEESGNAPAAQATAQSFGPLAPVMLYPLVFNPIFKERVWGGRNLERLYGKPLPPNTPIGESWEVSDRPGDVSVLANGPLAGKDLHWLMLHHGLELIGRQPGPDERFPLLVKLLDAQEVLSLQVHPPAAKAVALKGEPKTEMWFIAEAKPGAELYVGLKRGVTRGTFEKAVNEGTVAGCFHRVKVKTGDAMFLPSGRVHALGEGLVIFEIQQNSDTTYRVFDWNRTGLDGKPRTLHIAESLESIDFQDFEPSLVTGPFREEGKIKSKSLVDDFLFKVRLLEAQAESSVILPGQKLRLIGVVDGSARIQSDEQSVVVPEGSFCLLPACLPQTTIRCDKAAKLLLVEI